MRGLVPYSLLLGGAAVAAMASGACGELLLSSGDDDEPAPAPPPVVPAPDAASSDGSPSNDSGSTTDATVIGCTNPDTRLVVAKEDTSALGCAVSVTYGASTFLHAGYQDGNTDGKSFVYLKFELPPEVKSALTNDRVAAARLVLVEDPSQGVNKSGALAAHVLRNDWIAGVGAPYGGADKCRRDEGDPGTGWGFKLGPSSSSTRITQDLDYGVSIGAQSFAAADTQVTILLSGPTLRADWQKLDSSATELSLLVEEIATGSFVFASADHGNLAKPTLLFDVCP